MSLLETEDNVTNQQHQTPPIPLPLPSSPSSSSSPPFKYWSFEWRKVSFLSKIDKSSAGGIDPRAQEICEAINTRREYYTTSSCSGRCFLYRGVGNKKSSRRKKKGLLRGEEGGGDGNGGTTGDDVDGDGDGDGDGDVVINGNKKNFRRYRVTHDLVTDPQSYFDVGTIGDLNDNALYDFDELHRMNNGDAKNDVKNDGSSNNGGGGDNRNDEKILSPVFLRFEPFILHVACRSLDSASALMAAARPSFKNVGLTSWVESKGRYIVAIWGDEVRYRSSYVIDSDGKSGYLFVRIMCHIVSHGRTMDFIYFFPPVLYVYICFFGKKGTRYAPHGSSKGWSNINSSISGNGEMANGTH